MHLRDGIMVTGKMILDKDDYEFLDRIGCNQERLDKIKVMQENYSRAKMRLSLLAELLETNVDLIAEKILELKKKDNQ